MEGVKSRQRAGPVEAGLGSSPASGSSSDMFFYDDSSMSDGSLYASDQENLTKPRKRYLVMEKFDFDPFTVEKN